MQRERESIEQKWLIGMAAHRGSVPHSTPHGDALTLGSGTLCPPHGPAVAALIQLLLLMVGTIPFLGWFQHSLTGCPGLLPTEFAWELLLVHLSKSLDHASHTVGLSQWSSSPSPLEPQPQGDRISAPPKERSGKPKTLESPSPKVQKPGPCVEHMELPQFLHPQSEQ